MPSPSTQSTPAHGSSTASRNNATHVWVPVDKRIGTANHAAAAGGEAISPLGMKGAYSTLKQQQHQSQQLPHTRGHHETFASSSSSRLMQHSHSNGQPHSNAHTSSTARQGQGANLAAPGLVLRDHVQGSPQYWGGRGHSHSGGHGSSSSSSSSGHRANTGNPSVVTTAFRELQTRAKEMEEETLLLRAESADIQEKISAFESARQERSTKRGESQLRYTEALLAMRDAYNGLRSTVADQDVLLLHIDNDTRTVQVDTTRSRRLLASLEDDLIQLRSIMKRLQSENEARLNEFNSAFERSDELQRQVDSWPAAAQAQRDPLQQSVRETEAQGKELRGQMRQNENQFKAVSRYLTMLVGVNDEICNTVIAREEARERVLRLSGRVNLPYDPYSGTGGAMPHEARAPSLRGRGKGTESSPAVLVDELTQRALAISQRLAAAKKGIYIEGEGYDDDESDGGDGVDKGDGMGFVQHSRRGLREGEEDGSSEESNDDDDDVDESFTEVLGVLSRQASRQALETQAEVARHHARLLSQAASGSTAIRASTPSMPRDQGSRKSRPASSGDAKPPRRRRRSATAAADADSGSSSGSSSHGSNSSSGDDLKQLRRRSRGKAYAAAVEQMDPLLPPSPQAVAQAHARSKQQQRRRRAAEPDVNTRMGARRSKRASSAAAAVHVVSAHPYRNYLGITGPLRAHANSASPYSSSSLPKPKPPGSPPEGFGLALGASYGYEASARGAGRAARKRDGPGAPHVRNSSRRSSGFTDALLQGIRKSAGKGNIDYYGVDDDDDDEEERRQSTYVVLPPPPGPSAGAWMPSGISGDNVSANVVANKSAVYRGTKVARARTALNHYNKLHLAEL